ncbi:FAD-binding oxidoreductase [Candidatus Parcubacteria bacterium]|nr:FAD-binding oxidoreductase [Candidatus Parcubacteria bacterium]
MKHEVFWQNPGYEPRPKLVNDIECDYLIVGGGVAGVSTAYFLAKLGAKNIVLIEKGQIASGATGKAAGSLVVRGESDLVDHINIHGRETAERYWNRIQETLKEMFATIKDEEIDCDAEPQDTLYCGFEHKSDIDLTREYEEEKKIDSRAKFLEREELKKELNTDLYTHGILSVGHGLSVNPLKFTQNLSRALDKYGVTIYEDTSYLGSEGNVAKTPSGNIKYKKLVLAIDADHPALEVTTVNSTIVITRPLTEDELTKTGLIVKKIVWDSQKDYHYFKLTKDNRLLFGFGGMFVDKNHRDTIPHLPHLEEIKDFSKKLFPYLDNLDPEYAWAGNFGMTNDYEPHFKFDGDTIEMAGAGTQVVCFMAAEHIAHILLNKSSPMDGYFPSK